MLWTTLALIASLLPYIAKIFYWTAVSNFQTSGGTVICQVYDCYPVWQLMVGWDRRGYYWSIPSLLVVYNLFRAYITIMVVPMREEEERSGFAPKFYGLTGYRHIFLIHQYFVRWVLWIASVFFSYNVLYWLTQTVGVPRPI